MAERLYMRPLVISVGLAAFASGSIVAREYYQWLYKRGRHFPYRCERKEDHSKYPSYGEDVRYWDEDVEDYQELACRNCRMRWREWHRTGQCYTWMVGYGWLEDETKAPPVAKALAPPKHACYH